MSYLNCLFASLLLFLRVGIPATEAGNIRYNDYDFPEADDIFANRTFVRDRRPPTPSHNFQYFIRSSPPSSSPESPIGYEVACGIRGGMRGGLDVDESGNRIVGGTAASPGEFPWVISLQLLSGWIARHICGGTILSSYWIVTAGHCVADLKPRGIVVVAGDHDLFQNEGTEQRTNVVRIVSAGYTHNNFSSDIALLQVDPPLVLDGVRVAPVCLPSALKQYTSGNATVAGWGKLSEGGLLPHVLQHVTLPIMAQHQCRQLYDDAGYGKFITNCQLCGGYERGGVDSCQGDSGGPLVCQHSDKRYYLCGVVSWGVGCARPRLPGVYTQVSCYSDWIKTVLYNVNDYVSNLPAYI